jgi:hypothetical protein
VVIFLIMTLLDTGTIVFVLVNSMIVES